MTDTLENIPNELQPASPLDTIKIENFEGVGEITVGTGGELRIIVTAVVLLNDPQVNKYLLAQNLKIIDRMTKTRIFPREGMSLPDGEVYHVVDSNDKKEE